MEKDYLHKVAWLVTTTIAVLLAASFLPDISISGVELRRVELLADLFAPADDVEFADEPDAAVPADTLAVVREEFVDTCKQGMTCIEDFSTDGCGMEPYYAALEQLGTLDRPLRIAVLGDSFIEGDIITADLRDLLQSRYGGCGVGFVPMASEIAGFRRSVTHRFGGWSSHNSVGGGSYNHNIGILSEHYFCPDSAAWTQLTGQNRHGARRDTCYQASLLLMAADSAVVTASINGGQRKMTFDVKPSAEIQNLTVNDTIHSIRWRAARCSRSTVFYGATMECPHGIVLDNYSLRSSPGTNINYMNNEMLRKFDRARHYDLVILIYGLNVATPRGSDYKYYHTGMCKAINKLKETMPGTGFLLVSIGDRDERVDGNMRTMRGVKNLVRYQHNIAADSGIAFWNLFEAMGGEGSMAEMVKAHEANLDYTHINFKGGKRIAGLLFDAMEYGKEQRERRKAFYAGKEVQQ